MIICCSFPLIGCTSAHNLSSVNTKFSSLYFVLDASKANLNNMTSAEERQLPSAARDTLPMIDKFIDYESMHLEQYSTLSPTAQRELNFKLSQAEKNGDTKELKTGPLVL